MLTSTLLDLCSSPSRDDARAMHASAARRALEVTRRSLRRVRARRLRVSSTTRTRTCSRSATTSPTAGSTPSFYDLLASEARLAASSRSRRASCRRSTGSRWAACSRPRDGRPVLLSWSGSMFEYLMPLLVMPTYRGHAARRDLPRGRRASDRLRPRSAACRGASPSRATTRSTRTSTISTARSACPGLGLQARPGRGPGDRAVRERAGADGRARRGRARTCSGSPTSGWLGAVRLLRGDRLHADAPAARRDARRRALVHGAPPGHEPARARVRCCSTGRCSGASRPIRSSRRPMLLLQERVPRAAAIYRSDPAECVDVRAAAGPRETPLRVFATPNTPAPEVHLLSNGRYHVMVTNAGGGYSRWQRPRGHALARGRHARCLGHVLLPARRARPASVWSTTLAADAGGRRQLRGDLHRGVASSSAAAIDDIEAHTRDRRLARGRHRAAPHRASPIARASRARSRSPATPRSCSRRRGRRAASGVQQSVRADRDRWPSRAAILCTRRPRSAEEPPPLDDAPDGACTARRAGRPRSKPTARASSAAATASHDSARRMRATGPLSGSAGLGARSDRRDPPARRARARTDGRRSTSSRASPTAATQCLALVEKYRDRHLADRVFELAWTHSQVVLGQLNISEADAQLYGRLAGAIIYADPALRATARRDRQQPARRSPGCGATGSPATCRSCCCRSSDREQHRPRAPAGAGARLLAHEGTRRRSRDLERGARRLSAGAAGRDHGDRSAPAPMRAMLDQPGGIFVRAIEQINHEDRVLHAVGRARRAHGSGRHARRAARRASASRSDIVVPVARRRRARADPPSAAPPFAAAAAHAGQRPRRLRADGREYVIAIDDDAADAAAVGQRDRQPALRLRRVRERRRLYVVRERARIPR